MAGKPLIEVAVAGPSGTESVVMPASTTRSLVTALSQAASSLRLGRWRALSGKLSPNFHRRYAAAWMPGPVRLAFELQNQCRVAEPMLAPCSFAG